jgi:hypothetical protein
LPDSPNQLYKIEITPVGKSVKRGKGIAEFQSDDQPLEFEALYPMQNQKADRQPFFSWRVAVRYAGRSARGNITYAIQNYRQDQKTENPYWVIYLRIRWNGNVSKAEAFFTLSARSKRVNTSGVFR